MALAQKITTHLWFDSQAEEAVNFYCAVFKNSKIGRISYYGKAGFEIHGRKAGSVMTVEFMLEGQQYIALNGGPLFKFNEAVSLLINCNSQEEIDYYWERLSSGGDPSAQACGWLKDRFGLSWQVVPAELSNMLHDQKNQKAGELMNAFLQMKKIDLNRLTEIYQSR